MSKQQAKRQVELVEEYAANLAKLEAQAEANTAAILRRSLTGTLKDLRRAYGDFIDPELVAYADPTGQMVLRPGQYSAAQAAAKFRGLAEIAQGFMTPQELDTWERAFRVDLQRATVLGGELGHKLAEVVGKPRPGILRRFAGANRPAIEGAARQASAFIEGESAKFRQQLVQVVGDGVARGVGRGQMVQQVRMLLEGVDSTSKGLTKSIGTVQRARLIARSELANAYGHGARDLAMANGFGYIRWVATESERTCPVCAARHGRIYPANQLTIPAHPNCRCVGIPVPNELVEEEDNIIRDTLLDGNYWRESQAAVKDEYIRTANKTPAQADRILAAALAAPTASEKRVNPGISVGLQPSVPTDAPGGGGRSFEEAILAREQLVQQKQELEAQRLEAERARQEAEAAAKGQPWGAEVPPDVVIEHLGARAIEEWKQAGPAAREALYREAQRKKRKR